MLLPELAYALNFDTHNIWAHRRSGTCTAIIHRALHGASAAGIRRSSSSPMPHQDHDLLQGRIISALTSYWQGPVASTHGYPMAHAWSHFGGMQCKH